MGNETSQPVAYGDRLDNDVSVTWKKLDQDCPYPAREGHCAAAIGNTVYVFGGVIQAADDVNTETNELLCFNLDTSTWSKVDATGTFPAARYAASMATVGSSLYIFGGLSGEQGWLDGVHKFDSESMKWSLLETQGKGPSARDKLASAVIKDSIYIFGGFGPQVGLEELQEEVDDEEWEDENDAPQEQQAAHFSWFNDLFILDTKTNTWSNPMQMNLGVPTPRAAHAMCAVSKYLCIFGGRDSEARRNDIHIFNTETRKWEEVAVKGQQPEPRSYHSLTTIGSRVVVFGGRGLKNQHFNDFHIFDTATMQWLQPTIQGSVLPGRGLHTATVAGHHLVVFGGSSEFDPECNACSTFYNDTYTMKTEEILTGTPKAVSMTTGASGESTTQGAGFRDRNQPQTSSEQTSPDEEEATPSKRHKGDETGF